MNKKSITLLLSLLAITGVFFAGPKESFASVDSVSGTVLTSTVGTSGQAVITGTLSDTNKTLATSTYGSVSVEYGPIDATGKQGPLSSNPSSCTAPDANNAFTCTISGLANGNYYFTVGVYVLPHPVGTREVAAQWIPINTATNFSISLVLPYAVFGNTVVSGYNATITINAYNVPVTTQVYMQLGTATEVGTTVQYTCTPGSIQSTAITVAKGAGPIPVSYTFTKASGLTDNNYCIRVMMNFPGYPNMVSVGSGSQIDNNGYWQDKAALFSVGTATLVAGATINGAANPNGCVVNGNNTNYCLLAPLPGIGDSTGSLDVTTGIGPFINKLIWIFMGIIGILSVLMVVVGGIEYMSTVSIGEKEGAKERITNAIFGLLLALGSYIILNTINPKLVSLGVTVPGVTVSLSEDQGVETDETGTLPATKPPSNGIVVPTGSAQALAQQILNDSQITLDGVWGQSSSGATGNDAASTPKQNILDTAAGTAASTSASTVAAGQYSSVQHNPLSAKMLAGMLAVSQVTQITITAIEGSVHTTNSKHYLGRAFDIQADQSDSASSLAHDKLIGDACDDAGASLVITPCAGNESSGFCAATGYATNTGHKTHVHCEWPS